MLPLEVLSTVFGALPRDDLDTLLMVSGAFGKMVQRDFTHEPFRSLHRMTIFGDCQTGEVHFQQREPADKYDLSAESIQVPCSELAQYIEKCRLRHLRLFDFLLPFQDVWQNARISFDWPSGALLERAFGELFFCKAIHLDGWDFDLDLGQIITRTACISACSSLELDPCVELDLAPTDLTKWLYNTSVVDGCKELDIWELTIVGRAAALVERLKEDFVNATTEHKYAVKISLCGAYHGNTSLRLRNERTSEIFQIALTHSRRTDRVVIVSRNTT